MIDPQRPTSSHLPSLFLALISGFGVIAGLLGLLVFGLAAMGRFFHGGATLAWAAAFATLLNLPALIYAAPRAFGRPSPRWQVKEGWRLSSIALGFWVLDLAAASLLSMHPNGLTQLLMPVLSLLAVGIPIWWLIELGRRGLRTTPLRTWGTVSASLMGTVPLVIIVEVIGFVFLGIFILIWLVGQSPDLLTQIEQLGQSMANGNVGPDALLSTLQPYLEQPGVVLAGLLILAVITPMVEEFFKPLALWFIPGRRLTEAEGFTLGLVAGGIFALLETLGSLSSLSQRSELWLALVLTRTGTGLLHITCSGLTGWGLAAAWQNRRYLKFVGLYLLAVAIHGSWNFLAQLISLEGFMPGGSVLSFIGRAAPFLMAALAVVIFIGLVRINRYLRSQQPEETPPPPVFTSPQLPLVETHPPAPPIEE
jgi:hypothetical protein